MKRPDRIMNGTLHGMDAYDAQQWALHLESQLESQVEAVRKECDHEIDCRRSALMRSQEAKQAEDKAIYAFGKQSLLLIAVQKALLQVYDCVDAVGESNISQESHEQIEAASVKELQ